MLNLVNDAWIPVRRRDGSRTVIAPWQMADDGLAFPDWPRPDLNIACLELLIGLVFLADPPRDAEDWEDRRPPIPTACATAWPALPRPLNSWATVRASARISRRSSAA